MEFEIFEAHRSPSSHLWRRDYAMSTRSLNVVAFSQQKRVSFSYTNVSGSVLSE